MKVIEECFAKDTNHSTPFNIDVETRDHPRAPAITARNRRLVTFNFRLMKLQFTRPEKIRKLLRRPESFQPFLRQILPARQA